MNTTRAIYRAVRLSADARAIASGDPHRVERRLRHRLIARLLGRACFWAWLWK